MRPPLRVPAPVGPPSMGHVGSSQHRLVAEMVPESGLCFSAGGVPGREAYHLRNTCQMDLKPLEASANPRGRCSPDQDLTRLRTALRVLAHPARPLRQPQQDGLPCQSRGPFSGRQEESWSPSPGWVTDSCVSLDSPKPL